MSIPSHTSRAHYSPYWFADSPKAVEKARRARPKDPTVYIDQNFQLSTDNIPITLHWYELKKNGFLYLYTGKKDSKGREIRRPLTAAEKSKRVQDFDSKFLKNLRRTRRPGSTYASKVRPYSFWEMLKVYKKHEVICCPELKSYAFGTKPEIAAKMHTQVREIGITVYPMTLVTMRGWGNKLKFFKRAGFETALLAHGARKPKEFDTYKPWIDVVWGQWAK